MNKSAPRLIHARAFLDRVGTVRHFSKQDVTARTRFSLVVYYCKSLSFSSLPSFSVLLYLVAASPDQPTSSAKRLDLASPCAVREATRRSPSSRDSTEAEPEVAEPLEAERAARACTPGSSAPTARVRTDDLPSPTRSEREATEMLPDKSDDATAAAPVSPPCAAAALTAPLALRAALPPRAPPRSSRDSTDAEPEPSTSDDAWRWALATTTAGAGPAERRRPAPPAARPKSSREATDIEPEPSRSVDDVGWCGCAVG